MERRPKSERILQESGNVGPACPPKNAFAVWVVIADQTMIPELKTDMRFWWGRKWGRIICFLGKNNFKI